MTSADCRNDRRYVGDHRRPQGRTGCCSFSPRAHDLARAEAHVGSELSRGRHRRRCEPQPASVSSIRRVDRPDRNCSRASHPRTGRNRPRRLSRLRQRQRPSGRNSISATVSPMLSPSRCGSPCCSRATIFRAPTSRLRKANALGIGPLFRRARFSLAALSLHAAQHVRPLDWRSDPARTSHAGRGGGGSRGCAPAPARPASGAPLPGMARGSKGGRCN